MSGWKCRDILEWGNILRVMTHFRQPRITNFSYKITSHDQFLYQKLHIPGLILGFRPANERRRYKVTWFSLAGCKPRINPVYHQQHIRNYNVFLVPFILCTNCKLLDFTICYWFDILRNVTTSCFPWKINQDHTFFQYEINILLHLILQGSKTTIYNKDYTVLFCHFWQSILYDHNNSGYGLSQWETTLHSNAISHWLSPSPEWSM